MAMSPHIELELLAEEHRQAERRLASLERAPYESRVADRAEWERSLYFARQRLGDLARELRAARAEMDDSA